MVSKSTAHKKHVLMFFHVFFFCEEILIYLSLDGVGEVGEWCRKGLKMKRFERNLLRWQSWFDQSNMNLFNPLRDCIRFVSLREKSIPFLNKVYRPVSDRYSHLCKGLGIFLLCNFDSICLGHNIEFVMWSYEICSKLWFPL